MTTKIYALPAEHAALQVNVKNQAFNSFKSVLLAALANSELSLRELKHSLALFFCKENKFLRRECFYVPLYQEARERRNRLK